MLFDDPDDETIPQEETSTIVPINSLQESPENKNEMKDTEAESSIELTTTSPSFQSKTEPIITRTTTEEANTIRNSPDDAIDAEEADTKPMVFASTNTETNNILLEEFKPSTSALEKVEGDIVPPSNTTVTITTIPTTTMGASLSEFSSEFEASESKPNETIVLTNTRTNLIDIISPSKDVEKETYEFQNELEAINELNKTIHDIELSLASNETEAMDTNIEYDLEEDLPTLHNDALSHKNPLDTQDLENKVELIEIPYSDISNDEQIKEDIVNETLSGPTYVEEIDVEVTTLASTDTANKSTDIFLETQGHNVSTSTSSPTNTTTTSVTETTSTIPSKDEELQYDDPNEDYDGLNAEEATTITNLLYLDDDINGIDALSTDEQSQNSIVKKTESTTRDYVVNNNSNNHLEITTNSDVTSEQFTTSPSSKTTISTSSSSIIEDRENIEFEQTFDTYDTTSSVIPLIENDTNEPSNNNSRSTVFDETTTGSPIESSTTVPPLRIEAIVAEFEEEVQTTTEQEIFNETTTEEPLKHASNADPLPIFIPQVIEEEKIFETEAVISEEKPVFTLEEQKEFIYTTTLPPSTTEPESTTSYEEYENIGESKFDIEAVVAEEENDNKNEDGTFIETTTVSLRKLAASNIVNTELSGKEDDTQYSQIVDIRQSTNVNGPLDLETIADKPDADPSAQIEEKVLEKQARKEDTDVEVDDDILDLQKLSDEDSASNVPTTEEKLDSKTPGSLLTTFIDGFFVPKQKDKPKKKKKNPNKAFTSIRVISEKESDDEPNDNAEKEDVAVSEKDTSFPVSDILNGIYKLVSNFVTSKPKVSSEGNEPTTTTSSPVNFQQPQFGPINVHNMPRDQLIVEFLDEETLISCHPMVP